MAMKPIEYSEYKEVLDVLKRDDVESSYQDLMQHETKTLDTVNNVIKYYRDAELADSQLVNQSLHSIFMRFFDVWNQVLEDMIKVKTPNDVINVLFKSDRIIFIGLALILIALFLIFTQSSKPQG
jgi:hypothetical protein